jgi:hypothetical protein
MEASSRLANSLRSRCRGVALRIHVQPRLSALLKTFQKVRVAEIPQRVPGFTN